MANIIKYPDTDYLIERYRSGIGCNQIGRECGIDGQNIRKRLIQAGVTMRSAAEAKRAHFPQFDIQRLVSRYNDGDSINSIAKEHGVTRAVIVKLLCCRVRFRTQSEQERIKWSRMTADQRVRQVASAHSASAIKLKGRKPSLAAMLAKSRMWQDTRRMSAMEMAVSAHLTSIGIAHTPQISIGAYNLDFALDGLPVAVEVMRGTFGKKRRAKTKQRMQSLLDAGWGIVFVYLSQRASNDFSVMDKHLVGICDLARRDKSAIRKCWVIRCNPKPSTGLRNDLDGLPVVECTGSSVYDA
jgi:very-short-patch-repair endonuclease